MEDDVGAKVVLIICLLSLIVGGGILLFKKDYRIKDNLYSNRHYFPLLEVPQEQSEETDSNENTGENDEERSQQREEESSD